MFVPSCRFFSQANLRRYLFIAGSFFLLVLLALTTVADWEPAIAGNGWWRGNTVGLCAGTQIRQGPGYNFSVHTVVPENNWPVKIIDGPRYANGQTWWDISRQEFDGGGTGWISQSDADRCYGSPPAPTDPPPTPTQPPYSDPGPGPTPTPSSSCIRTGVQANERCVPRYNIEDHQYFYTYNTDCISIETAVGNYRCANQVTVGSDSLSFSASGLELTVNEGMRPGSSVGVYPIEEVGYEHFRPVSPTGFWHGPKFKIPVRWPNGILSFDFTLFLREVFEIKPPDPNSSYVYKGLMVIVVAVGVIAVIYIGVALIPAETIAGIYLFIASIFGVALAPLHTAEVYGPAPQVSHAAVDPGLVSVLRQGYGPLVDVVTLRPMQAGLPLIAAGSDPAATLPSIDYYANGFAPGANVLVVMDRAGVLVKEVVQVASTEGVVQGSFVLSAEQATTPGILSLIALSEDQIFAHLNALAGGVVSSSAAGMEAAAAAVTIAPAPRLVGDITFEPQPIIAGRWTTATYTIRNFGDVAISLNRVVFTVRGPDCDDWCDDKGVDWPGVSDLTLAPGESRTISTRQILAQPGQYRSVVAYQDIQGNWHDADGSPRFTFSVQPGLVIQEQISISPTNPLAGEMVEIRFAVRNASSTSLMFWNIVAAGRGPDCVNGFDCLGWNDSPSIRGVSLLPGQEYIYRQHRLFMKPGSYFIQPSYQYSPDDWRTAGTRLDFQVGSGLRVVRPLQFDPQRPRTGEPILASYTVRNDGSHSIVIPYLGVVSRGPECAGSSWECIRANDWPWLGEITLAPQQEYTFRSRQILKFPGSGYWAESQMADRNPWWALLEGSGRLEFAVQPGLELVTPLRLEPAMPAVGELVTARAVIRNASDRPLTLYRLFVGAQGPNCTDFTCTQSDQGKWNDFPAAENLTIAAGASYTYESRRVWLGQGADYVAQLMYQFTPGDWNLIGEPLRPTVVEGVVVAEGLRLAPASPKAGEIYTATFTLVNRSPRPLTLLAVGIGGRAVDCTDETCTNDVGMRSYPNITIPAGGRYIYSATRVIDVPGNYWIEPFIIGSQLSGQPDWWMSLVPVTGGQRVSFTVVRERGLEAVTPLRLEPAEPVVGELVTARAEIRNASERPITLYRLYVGAQGPNCTDFSCGQSDPSKWNDFPAVENFTIAAGASYTYESRRIWLGQGAGYVVQLMYQFTPGDWSLVGDPLHPTVSEGLVMTKGLILTPASPKVGQPYTATFTLANRGPRPLAIFAIGVGGRSVDCNDETCQNNAGMVAYANIMIPAGGSYIYIASRIIDIPGDYWIEPFIIGAKPQGQPDWWMSLTPIAGVERTAFAVVQEPTDPSALPPCTATIENGATFINRRSVRISINVPDATHLLVSNDGGFADAIDIVYQTGFDWQLPDLGQKVGTLLVRVRAYRGATLLCVGEISDDIIFDPLPPTVRLSWAGEVAAADSFTMQPLEPASSSSSMSPTAFKILQIDAWDQENGSGVSWMQVSATPDFTDAVWEAYRPIRTLMQSFPATIYIRVQDRAGNLSDVSSLSTDGVRRLYLPYSERR